MNLIGEKRALASNCKTTQALQGLVVSWGTCTGHVGHHHPYDMTYDLEVLAIGWLGWRAVTSGRVFAEGARQANGSSIPLRCLCGPTFSPGNARRKPSKTRGTLSHLNERYAPTFGGPVHAAG